MSAPQLQILIVGHGLIGRQRAAAVHALSARLPVRLAGTVDPLDRSSGLYPGAPHFRRMEDVELSGVDAAMVALPHDLAVHAARHLLEAGVAVLVEKPLGLTLADAHALEAAAEGLGRECFVGYNYRFLPHVRDLIRAATAGELGTLRSLTLAMGHGGHPRSAESWKLDPSRAGGGVLLDPGVHLLDLALAIDPELKPDHASATRGFWGTGIEEDLHATLSHGRLLASVNVSHVRWVNEFRMELIGEDGYAIAHGRGGNYGSMTIRTGQRWAWHDDPEGRSQRQIEMVTDYGEHDASLSLEVEAVVGRWLGASDLDDAPAPATFAEARRVSELVHDLYDRMILRE